MKKNIRYEWWGRRELSPPRGCFSAVSWGPQMLGQERCIPPLSDPKHTPFRAAREFLHQNWAPGDPLRGGYFLFYALSPEIFKGETGPNLTPTPEGKRWYKRNTLTRKG